MKVLVFVKATPNSEQGIVHDEKLAQMLEDMGKFNDELAKAGIIQDADGLKPSSAGKRIQFSDNGFTSVIDGPFAETKELVAGYWVWNVKSMEDAIAWAKRCPNPMPGEEGVLEIRPTYGAEEFEEIVTKAIGKRDVRPRKKVKSKAKKALVRKRPAKRKPARARYRK